MKHGSLVSKLNTWSNRVSFVFNAFFLCAQWSDFKSVFGSLLGHKYFLKCCCLYGCDFFFFLEDCVCGHGLHLFYSVWSFTGSSFMSNVFHLSSCIQTNLLLLIYSYNTHIIHETLAIVWKKPNLWELLSLSHNLPI